MDFGFVFFTIYPGIDIKFSVNLYFRIIVKEVTSFSLIVANPVTFMMINSIKEV